MRAERDATVGIVCPVGKGTSDKDSDELGGRRRRNDSTNILYKKTTPRRRQGTSLVHHWFLKHTKILVGEKAGTCQYNSTLVLVWQKDGFYDASILISFNTVLSRQGRAMPINCLLFVH